MAVSGCTFDFLDFTEQNKSKEKKKDKDLEILKEYKRKLEEKREGNISFKTVIQNDENDE